jgi:hypothetical protein
VSGAGARRRNPERSEGSQDQLGACRRNPERSEGTQSWRKRVRVERTGDRNTCRPPVLKLRRLRGVRAARRNPERSEGTQRWRKRVRVERTDDIERCRPPVLKTGRVTGPHALPCVILKEVRIKRQKARQAALPALRFAIGRATRQTPRNPWLISCPIPG